MAQIFEGEAPLWDLRMEMRVAGNRHQNKQQMSPSLRDGRRERENVRDQKESCSLSGYEKRQGNSDEAILVKTLEEGSWSPCPLKTPQELQVF